MSVPAHPTEPIKSIDAIATIHQNDAIILNDLRRTIGPLPETALACRIALAPVERARAAWHEWHALLGVGGVMNVSHPSGRIMPLFAHRLEALGLADDPTAGRLRGVHRRSLTHNFLTWHGLRPLLERLVAAGLRVVLVGAIGRARTVYPDFGGRYLLRTDLWIPPEEIARAIAIVRSFGGWRTRFSVLAEPPVSDRHVFTGTHGAELILRSHLVPESLGHGADPWARCTPLVIDGLPLLQLAPEHALIQVAVDAFEAHDPRASDRYVEWLADLALTIARGLDWSLLVAEAQRYEVSLTLATALACLPPIGVELPAGVLPALAVHTPHEARALAARLAPRRPIDTVWRDYRHAVAPAATPLTAALGFVRYAALRLGVRGPRDALRVAGPTLARLRARLRPG